MNVRAFRGFALLLAVLVSGLVGVSDVRAAGLFFDDVADGDWTSLGTWDNLLIPGTGVTSTPGANDAVFKNNAVTITVSGNQQFGGANGPGGSATTSVWNAGSFTLQAGGSLTHNAGGNLFSSGAADIGVNGTGTVINNGSIFHTGQNRLRIDNNVEFVNNGRFEDQTTAAQMTGATSNHLFTIRHAGESLLTNNGIFRKSGSAAVRNIESEGTFNNLGTVEVTQGTLSFSDSRTFTTGYAGSTITQGTWQAIDSGTLHFSTGGPAGRQNIETIGENATIVLGGTGSISTVNTSLTNVQGKFHLLDGKSFTTGGNLQNSGELIVGNVGAGDTTRLTLGVSGSNTLTNTGVLRGTGMIDGNVVNSGTITAGLVPGEIGTLTIGTLGSNRTLSLEGGTELAFDLGNISGLSDQIHVNGDLVIGSGLTLNLSRSGELTTGSWNLFTFTGDLTGQFDEVLYNGAALDPQFLRISYLDGAIQVSMVPEPGSLLLLAMGVAMLVAFYRRKTAGAAR